MENGSQTEENRVPLLDEKREISHPHCPGCNCAHLSAEGAGPPIKELFMIGSLFVCNSLPIASLYPFLYFMVEDFHIAKTEDIGYYAGVIGSVFMFGRMISSVSWGKFADKFGRKPVMYCGLISIILFQMIFGMAKNFYVALIARFLLGTFNGIQGPMRAYASEVCNEENQPWATSVVGTAWSLGLIIGPAIGGFLSRPVINFPGIFSEDSLFARFPYLLPSICQATFAIIELGVVYLLPETIHKHEKALCEDAEPGSTELDKPHRKSLWQNWPLMASIAVYCSWSVHETSFSEVFPLWCVSPVENGDWASKLQMWELCSLYQISVPNKDWSQRIHGPMLWGGFQGAGMIVLQMTLFPPFAKYFGAILATRTPAIIVIPLVVIFPFVAMLHGLTQSIVLNLLALTRNTMSAMVITGTFLLVNNSVYSQKKYGEKPMESLTCASIFRAIGPGMAGAIFAFGQSRSNATFLPDSQMVFFVIASICVLSLFTMFLHFCQKLSIGPTEPIGNKNRSHEPCDKKTMVHVVVNPNLDRSVISDR